MHRRTLASLPMLALVPRQALAEVPMESELTAALARFTALSGTTSYVIDIPDRSPPWRAEHNPRAAIFVGSAIKTFILATFLREMEAGRLSEDEQWPIDDNIRSPSSPSFLHLTGTAPARMVLEAMIAHSDNMATDAVLSHVGVEKVRAFVAAAGLQDVRIPDSTRRLFSYLAGAGPGVDVGWAGAQQIMADKLFGPPRSPLNDQQTMICSAATFVDYYQRALHGEFFAKPATLTEFRRIQSMADALPMILPPNILGYAKGGSIDWQDFHALCVPGQMLLGPHLVTFCFTLNWNGADSGVPAMMQQCVAAVSGILSTVAKTFG
jgi:beta-lactamase class A